MAIILNSQPPEPTSFYYLNECLQYSLSLDDLGTDPIIKKILYEVKADTEAGSEIDIVPEQEINPLSTSQIITFNTNKNIADSFDNLIPLLDGQTSPQTWTGFVRKAFIKYGELVIDNGAALTRVGTADQESDKQDVIYGYIQPWDLGVARLAIHPLTDSDKQTIYFDSHCWLLIYLFHKRSPLLRRYILFPSF